MVTKTSHLPIRYFLALLWAHPILHISAIRVNVLLVCWVLVWLFLATVPSYMNCLARMVHVYQFWALATFLVSFSVLSCWTNRAPSMCKKCFSSIWKKNHTIRKKQYMCWMVIIFLSVGLHRTNTKIGNTITVYTSENCSRKFHAWVFTLDAGLLARSQYSEGPATGHLDTCFSWFPCVYK